LPAIVTTGASDDRSRKTWENRGRRRKNLGRFADRLG
jgi:hypothetical protein